jgi:hypothetical protein
MDMRVSGGVCTGVIVALIGSALERVLCEEEVVACIVSLEGFAEHGLGSFPGGDESVLVNGVSACICPAYAIFVLVEEKMDEVELDTELAEPRPFKSPPERLSWSSGGELRLLIAEFLFDRRGAGGAGVEVGD